jgi:hypothetical protein
MLVHSIEGAYSNQSGIPPKEHATKRRNRGEGVRPTIRLDVAPYSR